MPAPTTDELYDFIGQIIGQKATDDKHPLFEWNCLKTNSFRYFRTTSTAIEKRMETLVEEGRLARVVVSHHGFVRLDHEEFKHTIFNGYFQYEKYTRDTWGYVTSKRPSGYTNVWRDGSRYLYTTRPRLEAMTAFLLEAKKRQEEGQKKADQEEKVRTEYLLNQISPDATALLERFDTAVPGIDQQIWSAERADQAIVYASINIRDSQKIGLFLDILRRGLPDVPRGTEEN